MGSHDWALAGLLAFYVAASSPLEDTEQSTMTSTVFKKILRTLLLDLQHVQKNAVFDLRQPKLNKQQTNFTDFYME